jgi:hypothetical protein
MTILWPEHSYEVHLWQQEVLLKEKYRVSKEKTSCLQTLRVASQKIDKYA